MKKQEKIKIVETQGDGVSQKTERLVFFYDLSITAESRTFKAPKPISVRKAFQLMELVP